MRDSVLRAEIRGPDSRFSEHTCLWLLVPAPGCEPKLTVTADVKWQGHIHTQRKAILVGSTLAELEYRVQSPRLLASRISLPPGSQCTLGPLFSRPASLPRSPPYCVFPLFLPYHELQQTCIENVLCVKASKSLQSTYAFKDVFISTSL